MSATRLVPGAPLPPQKSSQKKKKKVTPVVDDSSAAPSPLTATQNLEVVANGASNQGTPPAPSTPAVDSQSLPKLSPVMELISKRLKITQKKVVCVPKLHTRVRRPLIHTLVQKRIKDYNIPGAELNQDQIRSIASLPNLEAALKELEEVKKSFEVRRPTCHIIFSGAIDDG